jgi:hypothetical protein
MDLFARPQRYDTAGDLASEAAVPLKRLYKEFSKAGLRPPKQLVAVAKTMHGYGYLRLGGFPQRSVQKLLGYSDPECFARQVFSVLGCGPQHLAEEVGHEEFVLRVMEWFCKPGPSPLAPSRRGTASS